MVLFLPHDKAMGSTAINVIVFGSDGFFSAEFRQRVQTKWRSVSPTPPNGGLLVIDTMFIVFS